MGQLVKALVLGIELTNKLGKKLCDKDGVPIWNYTNLFKENEKIETGDQNDVLGFSFAENDIDNLYNTFALEDVEKVYAKDIKKARKLWDRLQHWVETEDICYLPEPKIFLVTVERA